MNELMHIFKEVIDKSKGFKNLTEHSIDLILEEVEEKFNIPQNKIFNCIDKVKFLPMVQFVELFFELQGDMSQDALELICEELNLSQKDLNKIISLQFDLN
jgi:hypothetical protein